MFGCRQPCVSLDDLEGQILEFLKETTPPGSLHRWAMTRLERESKQRNDLTISKRASIEQTRGSVERQLDNLTKLRVRDLVDDDEFLRQRQELERDRIRTAQGLQALGRSSDWFEPARLLISFNNQAVSRFISGDLPIKRLILEITGSNLVLTDQKLNIDAKKPFRRWAETASNTDLRRRKDSNLRGDYSPNILAGCCLQPLGHASVCLFKIS